MAYTDIDDPSAYFHTQLYTGDGNTNRDITNDANAGDFQPDFLWLKNRTDSSTQHMLFNSTVGMPNHLNSDLTDAEQTATNKATAFNADGFRVQDHSQVNGNSKNYVAWQWKANGGTTTTNDASATSVGTIDSVYQANTTAGFSIVTYTGTTSAGTIAHGLGAVPKMIIIKNRDDGAENWAVYHAGIASDAETDYIYLDSTNAASDDANLFNDTAPTSTVFSIGTSGVVNQAEAHIAYCFAEKKGYSKFGSYTGNANADGAFVYTGFKPAWLMVKRTDSSQNWAMYDNKRNDDAPAGANVIDRLIYPNANDAEVDTGGSLMVDFLSNGFKMRGTSAISNGSGTHIYMAFAEHPFVSSKGVPTTAR